MIACGENVFLTGERLNLPYPEQVIVRLKPTGMWMIQYVVIEDLPCNGQWVRGKMFEYHPDNGGYYTVSDAANWDAEHAESFILMARQLGKWLEHPAKHLVSVTLMDDGESGESHQPQSHFEFLHSRRRAMRRGLKGRFNRRRGQIMRPVDKATLIQGKEAYASA